MFFSEVPHRRAPGMIPRETGRGSSISGAYRNSEGENSEGDSLFFRLRSGLERNLPGSEFAELVFEPDADQALEHCEEIVIVAWRTDAASADSRRATLLEHAAAELERHLVRQMRFEDLMEKLRSWLTPRDYDADTALANADEPQEGLQLLLSGRASAYDAAGVRLHQFSPGDVIWLAGAAGGRVTSVVADEACRAMVLTPAARRWLEEHEERLALDLYRYMLTEHFGTEPE